MSNSLFDVARTFFARVIHFSIDLLVAFDYHAGALQQMSELLEPRGPFLQLFLPLPGDAGVSLPPRYTGMGRPGRGTPVECTRCAQLAYSSSSSSAFASLRSGVAKPSVNQS
jgi:hypothetical protein